MSPGVLATACNSIAVEVDEFLIRMFLSEAALEFSHMTPQAVLLQCHVVTWKTIHIGPLCYFLKTTIATCARSSAPNVERMSLILRVVRIPVCWVTRCSA